MDLWTLDGQTFRFPMTGEEDVGSVIAACLELAQVVDPRPRSSTLLS